MATDGVIPGREHGPRGQRGAHAARPARKPDEAELIERLDSLRDQLVAAAAGWRPWTGDGDGDRDASARNLLQYLALREGDLRDLQDPLTALGLSSLGRTEGHVQASVDSVIDALAALVRSPAPPRADPAPMAFGRSRSVLAARTEALLGAPPRKRPSRIMVTMPSEAASDPALVRDMLAAGMDCMRINCAHDAEPQWRAMCENLAGAQERTGRRARVLVDLPGPKLRTGPLGPKPKCDGKGEHLRLHVGDRLVLVREGALVLPGPAERAAAWIACSLPEAFAVTRRGHHVWFDDGKLGGVVESTGGESIALRITAAGPKGAKLREGKGINLPDAVLDIDLLGSHSEEALRFASERADIVGLSFVSRPRDVARVHEYLDHHAGPRVGVILKIETRRAFANLPALLLEALGGDRPAGVMIARGDLAVECGYQRLAEVQQEILWLCQAAQVPVVWATQVLDQLARTGRPSRAEISDAAMGVQAECVMLNKGPWILEAITVLDDILRRMERHQRKKRSLLAPLGVAKYVHTLE